MKKLPFKIKNVKRKDCSTKSNPFLVMPDHSFFRSKTIRAALSISRVTFDFRICKM